MRRILTACFCLSLGALSGSLQAADSPVYDVELLGKANKGDEQALAKLLELAEGGNAQAQYDVAQHYLRTIKSDDDFPRIMTWMRKAAEQGVSRAQIDLGVTLNMPGRPWHDPVQSLKWFNVGMALTLKESPDGGEDYYAAFAVNAAFKVSQSLTRNQVLEAEGLSRAWLDAHGVNAREEARNLDAFLKRYKAKLAQETARG